LILAILLGLLAIPKFPVSGTKLKSNVPTLSICSFNLRGADIDDGENSWEPNRKDLTLNILKDFSPNIIGTQEGWSYQLDYISQKSKSRYLWFGRTPSAGEHCDSAIMYDHQVMSSLAEGVFWLSETPNRPGSKLSDSALVRTCTWGHFKIKNGADFYLFNTHLDHIGENARRKQAEILLSQMKVIISGQSQTRIPVFITGDFNSMRGSQVWKIFTSNFIDSSIFHDIGAFSTFHAFQGKKLESPYYIIPFRALSSLLSFMADGPFVWYPDSFHFDWILFKDNLKANNSLTQNTRVITYDVIDKEYFGRYPSDHYPVLAQFELNL